MAILFCILGVLNFEQTPQNLLLNPAFESLVVDMPQHWDLFVMPLDGAYGRIDSEAIAGKFSVMLHTPEPGYTTEPYNNWSQSIVGDFAGKTIHLSGFIQTEHAKSAALWLQCWRKQPIQVIEVYSTVHEYPVAGSQAWVEVSIEAEIPEGTDFLVVRCVLRGTGTAWFDALNLIEVEKTDSADVKTSEVELNTGIEQVEAQPVSEDDTNNTNPESQDLDILAPLLKQLESELSELRTINAMLTESFKKIQDENKALQYEIDDIKNQIQSLPMNINNPDNTLFETESSSQDTDQSETVLSEIPGNEVTPIDEITHIVPPLIPHDFELKESP